jgi:hemoglobin
LLTGALRFELGGFFRRLKGAKSADSARPAPGLTVHGRRRIINLSLGLNKRNLEFVDSSTVVHHERSYSMANQSQPTLYERLGGVYSIATVVDDFIDRIMVDPRLNANPRVDEAHHRVSPAGFKYLVTEMVCWAAGGPQKYTGRSMLDSHRDLMITAPEWEAFLDDLQQTLEKFGVPQAEQAELKAIVASTRADIVV